MIPIYEADRLEDLPLFDRGPQAEADVGAAVDTVLEAVRTRGDEALRGIHPPVRRRGPHPPLK